MDMLQFACIFAFVLLRPLLSSSSWNAQWHFENELTVLEFIITLLSQTWHPLIDLHEHA